MEDMIAKADDQKTKEEGKARDGGLETPLTEKTLNLSDSPRNPEILTYCSPSHQ